MDIMGALDAADQSRSHEKELGGQCVLVREGGKEFEGTRRAVECEDIAFTAELLCSPQPSLISLSSSSFS